tara:strand:+ start:38 stop:1831 length:1794 start_codon:yes stop_codon:yes gene_type:complete
MDKIFGESFDEYVDKQVTTRQASLAKHQKDVADLQVFNSSTPWTRLTSSIRIGAQRTEELSNNLDLSADKIEGRNLAKNLVLFAGASKGDDLKNRIGGVGYGLDNAYGFLSDKEQGYKPMPGITGTTVKYKNNGSLKQAQVNITCFTRKQFEALEILYLRLGFTVILEWGHSVYFDNNGVKQNMSAMDIPNLMFTSPVYRNPSAVAEKAVEKALRKNPNLEWYKKDEVYFDAKRKQEQLNKNKGANATRIRTDLLKTKETTGGNYDGMLAKVSNFSWNLNSDLSYSITLDLISVGDIIDSLKMNVGGTKLTNDRIDSVEVEEGVQNITTVALNASTSTFHSFLYELTATLLDPKLVTSETAAATQELLELADQAKKARPLIGAIKTAITDAVRARKSTFESFQEARALLQANPDFTLITEGTPTTARSYGYEKNPGVVLKLNTLIREHNKVAKQNDRINEKFLLPDRVSIVLLNNLGLDVEEFRVDATPLIVLDSDLFISGKVVDKVTDDNTIYTRNKVTIEKLNRITVYFENLKARGRLDPEVNTTNLIFYLDKHIRENRSDIPAMIDRLLANETLIDGPISFDKEGLYPASFLFN